MRWLAVFALAPAFALGADFADVSGIEDRLANLERRVDALEGRKTRDTTDSPWRGDRPGYRGREVLYFGADWCKSCPSAEDRLGNYKTAIYKIDCSDENEIAERYGVSSLPTLIAIDDGREVERTSGNSVGSYYAKKWLNGESTRRPTVTRTVAPQPRIVTRPPPRNDFQPVRITIPPPVVRQSYIPQNRGPGHTHRCGRCGPSWSHEDWNVGNPAAHTCPSCGTLTYGNRTEGWQASRPVQTRTMPRNNIFQPRVMLSGMGSFCPTCPR